MPWVTPSSVSTGDTLQASEWNQSVVLNSLMGQPVFTNEAARDAAIPSPSEGQACYLTAPTVPTAAGATTFIPGGVQTIYNGSVWVCVTPVSAYTSASGTTTSTSYTATLSGSPGTNPSVTLVTGTTAIITVSCEMAQSGVGAGNSISAAVSGAGTVAASDNNRGSHIFAAAPGYFTTSTAITVISGLTAGTNTFTLQYKVTGNTGTFQARNITVQGIA